MVVLVCAYTDRIVFTMLGVGACGLFVFGEWGQRSISGVPQAALEPEACPFRLGWLPLEAQDSLLPPPEMGYKCDHSSVLVSAGDPTQVLGLEKQALSHLSHLPSPHCWL